MFRNVVRQLPLLKENLITDDLGKVRSFMNGKYDAVIVGSDEIWKLDGMFTTFFHGMCFAINANTPFVILEQRDVSEPRFSKSYDLLARNGAEGCYIQANRDAYVWEKLGRFVRDVLSGCADADYSAIKCREQEISSGVTGEMKKL